MSPRGSVHPGSRSMNTEERPVGWVGRRRGGWVFLSLLLSVSTLPVGAVAQHTGPGLGSCGGRTVSEIVITPEDPSLLSIPRSLRPLARVVGLLHTTSKQELIGRFVLLAVGQECTERKRAETERILRLQPFLADATVRAVDDLEGGVRIEVHTIDEIPTVFGMRVHGFLPSALRFGNGNVGGQGLSLAGSVERGFAYRTGFGVRGTAYQAFRRPYTLSLVAERAPLGGTLSLLLDRPFFTDLQRRAWHVGFRDVDRHVSFVRPEADPLSLAVERRFWDAGGVVRIGLGRRRAFAGAMVTAETMRPDRIPVIVSDSGLVVDSTGVLDDAFAAYRNLRLNAVAGVRALSFMTVRGFDALTAAQDVATGLQIGAVVGRSIAWVEGYDDDLFLAADLYAGHGSPASFAALRIEGEARREVGTGRWDAMVAGGRLAWYLKPAAAHVLIGSAELGGAWRERVPFQLALGDRRGGVRGYGASRIAGGARAVVRLEDRWSIGSPTRHAAFGLVGFVDAGWVRAGEVPFGVDSRMKVGAGFGLLGALPPRSQRLWRLDVAIPLSADPHARWEVRITSSRVGPFWREPEDVSRGRAGASPSTIFGWP